MNKSPPSSSSSMKRKTRQVRASSVVLLAAAALVATTSVEGFTAPGVAPSFASCSRIIGAHAADSSSVAALQAAPRSQDNNDCEHDSDTSSPLAVMGAACHDLMNTASAVFKDAASVGVALAVAGCLLASPLQAGAEDELAEKYGNGKGFDSSLVDQTCLVDKCSLQATACLKDDPSCRKGLTCTAKCMGDNACITGCMARYGDKNLDNLLKCTIEDNSCIKIAILEGGSDTLAQAPKPPAPTVNNFKYDTLEGTWYKVMGYNPNYDCYACQRNTFTPSTSATDPANSLQVDVEFSMPHLLPDGTPAPPSSKERERIVGGMGGKSIGMNEYSTHEVMEFDTQGERNKVTMNKGKTNEASYARTAHSEGEMFGLSKYIAV
jgi:hypothetical protein